MTTPVFPIFQSISPLRGETIVSAEGYPTQRFVLLMEELVRVSNILTVEVPALKARIATLESEI